MTDETVKISTTTDGLPPRAGYENAGAPAPINPETGQHSAYWVLNEEERAKGFIRPVRRSYKHVGIRPKYPLRDLTEEERPEVGYVKFEEYPASESPLVGRFWTAAQLNSGCGTVTHMGQAIAETYAAQPDYYGSTFCCGCGHHLPVGEKGEFVWMDGGRETTERVGT